MADRSRHDELMDKRKRVGLTDAEADELGQLIAELAGRGEEYDSARRQRARRDRTAGASEPDR